MARSRTATSDSALSTVIQLRPPSRLWRTPRWVAASRVRPSGTSANAVALSSSGTRFHPLPPSMERQTPSPRLTSTRSGSASEPAQMLSAVPPASCSARPWASSTPSWAPSRASSSGAPSSDASLSSPSSTVSPSSTSSPPKSASSSSSDSSSMAASASSCSSSSSTPSSAWTTGAARNTSQPPPARPRYSEPSVVKASSAPSGSAATAATGSRRPLLIHRCPSAKGGGLATMAGAMSSMGTASTASASCSGVSTLGASAGPDWAVATPGATTPVHRTAPRAARCSAPGKAAPRRVARADLRSLFAVGCRAPCAAIACSAVAARGALAGGRRR